MLPDCQISGLLALFSFNFIIVKQNEQQNCICKLSCNNHLLSELNFIYTHTQSPLNITNIHTHAHTGKEPYDNSLINYTTIKIIQFQNKNTRDRKDTGKQEASFTTGI